MLSANLAASSSLTGVLMSIQPVGANLTGTSTLTGVLASVQPIGANLTASSSLTGAMGSVSMVSLAATLGATSSLTGTFGYAVPPVTNGPCYFQAQHRMIFAPSKLAVEVWNIGVDFSPQLLTGETITSGFASVISGSCAVTYDNLSGTVATVTVSGGTSGARSIIQVGVNTSTGEVLAENITISVV